MRHLLLILSGLLIFNGLLLSQTDSIGSAQAPQNISIASLKAKEISIDLSNPENVELALKRIHTFKYLESVIFEGEADENKLSKVMYRLSVLKNLTALTFRDNGLKKISENISGIKTLRTITVEGNSTLDYNDLCTQLSHTTITELNLIDNDLKKIPATLSEIKLLRKIKISGNNQLNYQDLVEELAKIPGLIGLAIPVNYLTELPKNITKLTSLQVLDVSNNILTDLPDGVSSLKAINNLAIQGNLLLTPAKDLEKLQGADIRFLSLDKEVSGEDIEQIKKMFPKAEINFPIEKKDIEEEIQQEINTEAASKKVYNGELKTKKESKILSAAYLSYPAFFQGLVYNFDTLGFEERYANLNYTNVYQRLLNRRPVGGNFSFERGSRIGVIKGWLSRKIFFQIPDYNQSITSNYPELRAFSGMSWLYQGELSKKKFKKSILKKSWDDIRIELDKNNSMFSIQLKSLTGFEKFNAYPIVSREMSLEKTQQTYVRRSLTYQKTLSRRSAQFKRDQNRVRKKYDANFQKMKEYAWKELQLKMSSDEKLMSMQEWLEYYDNIVANEKKAIDNTSLSLIFLIRQLTLLGFSSTGVNTTAGTNVRRNNTIPMNNTGYQVKALNVDFIDADGSGNLAVTNIITVDNRNKFFSQMNGTLGLAPSILSLRQFSSYLILVELRNGNFGFVTSNEIDRQAMQTDKTCQFKVKVLDKNLDTIGNLLKQAGLE